MALSREVRRLQSKWDLNTGWPKRLDGQGSETGDRSAVMAVVGENGVGKSTIVRRVGAGVPCRQRRPSTPGPCAPRALRQRQDPGQPKERYA